MMGTSPTTADESILIIDESELESETVTIPEHLVQRFDGDQRSALVREYLETHGPKTLQELKDGFEEMQFELPFADLGDSMLQDWLRTINGIRRRMRPNGAIEFLLGAVDLKRKHESPLASPPRKTPRKSSLPVPQFEESHIASTALRNKDRPYQPHHQTGRQHSRPYKIGNPNLYSCVLLGDNNFLNIAEYELKFQLTPNQRIRQSGYCVSGMSIVDATRRVLGMSNETIKRVIVNVGTVDIMQGRQLIEIIDDYLQLLAAFEHVGISPILTTLAPIPHHTNGNKLRILEDFNYFLRDTLSKNSSVIDLNKCMLRRDKKANSKFYQPTARYCSGFNKSLLLWNKIGRSRVLSMIIKNLGAALVYNGGYVGDYF